MERWREVLEKHQAEFRNCIRAFRRMRNVWSERADWSTGPSNSPSDWSFGHAAYARRQAAMYETLLQDSIKSYHKCHFEPIPGDTLFHEQDGERAGPILADMLVPQRARIQKEDETLVAQQVERAAQFNAVMKEMG